MAIVRQSICKSASRCGSIIFQPNGDWLVIGCIVLVGIASFSAPKVSDVFLAILVSFGGYIWVRFRRRLTLSQAFSIVWLLFVVGLATYATVAGVPGKHFAQLGKHLPIALGPIVAVALTTVTRRYPLRLIVSVFLGSLAFGAAVVLLWNGGLGILSMMFHGHLWTETNLGRLNRNFAALSAGVGLISTLALVCEHWTSSARKTSRNVVAVLLVSLAAYFAIAVVALQSRGAYAATAAALCVQLSVLLGRALGWRAAAKSLVPSAVIVVLALAIAAHQGAFSNSRLVARGGFVNNLVTAKNIVAGARLSDNSPREDRLELLAIGVDLIRQRPWWGWGTDVAEVIHTHSPNSAVASLRQLHNGYLQTVVHFGVVGTILLAGLLWSIIRSAIRSGDGRLSSAQLSMCLAFVAFLLVFNLSETILFVSPAAAIAMFLSAIACTSEKRIEAAGWYGHRQLRDS
jgi:O-antigen ligase